MKYFIVTLGVIGAIFAIWGGLAIDDWRHSRCRGQCSYDRDCVKRCFEKGWCPAGDTPDWLKPAVAQ